MSAVLERAAVAHQQGDGCDELFESLYRRYEDDVFRLARRITGRREDAEDVTQIAFLNAYRALAHGNPPRQPRAWLLAIARNVCSKRFRAERHRAREVPLDSERFEARPSGDAGTVAELRSALDRLSLEHRSALVMRELGELSYAEIAARLGVSIPAVEARLFRARRALRRELVAAELTPSVRARRDERKRRPLRSLLPWPAGLGKPLGWIESLGRAGLGLKVAAAVSAASVIGTSGALGTERLPAGVSTARDSSPAAALSTPRLATAPGSAVRQRGGAKPEAPSLTVPAQDEPRRSEDANVPASPQPASPRLDPASPPPPAGAEPAKLALPEVPAPSAPNTPEVELPAVVAPTLPEPPGLELPDLPAPALPEPQLPELEAADLPPVSLPPPPPLP